MKKYFKFIVTLIVILNITTKMAHALLQVPSENKISTQEVDRLQKIKEKGVLTVLSSGDEPHSYKDSSTGIYSGIDAEIIQEIAKRLGIKEVRVRYLPFINLLDELNKNSEVDLISQALSITDERKQLVNFTNPIYTDEEGILTGKSSTINSKEDLKYTTIGTVRGTVFETMAKKWKQQRVIKDYIAFSDNNSLQTALNDKLIETILIGTITEQNYLSKDSKSTFKLLSPNQYKPELKIYFGYALKKEDTTLLNAINDKLEEMKNDGTLYQILVKYGVRDHYIP